MSDKVLARYRALTCVNYDSLAGACKAWLAIDQLQQACRSNWLIFLRLAAGLNIATLFSLSFEYTEAATNRKSKPAANHSFAMRMTVVSIMLIGLLFLLIHHQANAASEHERYSANRASQETNTKELLVAATRSGTPVITYENGVYTVFDNQRSEHAFIRQPQGNFKALAEHSGTLVRSPAGNFLWNDKAVVTLIDIERADITNATDTDAPSLFDIGLFDINKSVNTWVEPGPSLVTSLPRSAFLELLDRPNSNDQARVRLPVTKRNQFKLARFECLPLPVEGNTGSPENVTPGANVPADTIPEASIDIEPSVDDAPANLTQDTAPGPDTEPDITPTFDPTLEPNLDPDSENDADIGANIDQEPDTSFEPGIDPLNDPIQNQDVEQCDSNSEEPHSFLTTLNTGAHVALDARPASCQSYFVEFYGTDRGFEIEAGLQAHAPYNLMQSTLRTFPVIDFMDESNLYVVTSRDLGNRTFNSSARPDALYEQLIDDAEDIQHRFVDVLQEQGVISASELGQSTTISIDQLQPLTLQLIIRDGMASPSHWSQIARARQELAQRFGITLEVVVIP